MSKARDIADLGSNDVLDTSSSGVDVTGSVTADGLTVDGDVSVTTGDIEISNSTPSIRMTDTDTNATFQLNASSTSGIVQYEADIGSVGSNPEHWFKSQGRLVAKIHDNADVSFYDTAGSNAKFFWDASAESLGIGTSSPATALDVTGTVTCDGLLAGTSGGADIGSSSVLWQNAWLKNGGRLYFGDSGTNIYGSSSLDTLIFTTTNAERMRIDSSGNVGIGTSSPATNLHISYTGANNRNNLVFSTPDDGTNFNALIGGNLAVDASGTYTTPANNVSGSGIEFSSANSANSHGYIRFLSAPDTNSEDSIPVERMRIDSSGNLLIGTTETSLYNNSSDEYGTRINSSGQMQITNEGVMLYVNRQNTNGTMAQFRYNGNVCGQIDTFNTDLAMGTADTGIRFADSVDAIYPYDPSTTTNRDDAISLGASSQRFKDLYLSGGIYLGGTGSANYLDDYEEGAFTCTLYMHSDPSNTSGTNTTLSTTGYYTKVGDICHVSIYFNVSNYGGYIAKYVTGLPFTSSGSGLNNFALYHPRGVQYRYGSTTESVCHLTATVSNSSTQVSIQSSAGAYTSSGWWYLNSGTTTKSVGFSGTYKVA